MAPIAAALLSAGLYLAAAHRVPWPWRRSAAFIAGLSLVVAVTRLDDPLTVHMAAHALVASVAAPLLLIGAPFSLAVRNATPFWRRRLAATARLKPLRMLVHPLLAFSLLLVVQAAFHLTALFTLAEQHPWLHMFEHLLFLATALLYWLPVLGPWRLHHGALCLYLFAGATANDLVAALFMADGHAAAGAAMIAAMLPMALAAILATWSWLVAEERQAVALEAHATHG